MKMIKGILYGTDMLFSLFWFSALILLAPHMGIPSPIGAERYVALAVAILFAHLPDADMVPYKLIRRGWETRLVLAGILLYAVFSLCFYASGELSLLFTGIALLFGFFRAFKVRSIVRQRSSHWPIWHVPVLFLGIVTPLVWSFANDFSPYCISFYLALTIPLLVSHFLHDSIQKQGFPYLSPLSGAHYRIQLPLPIQVPWYKVEEHYAKQAAAAKSQSGKEDLERRLEEVTPAKVLLFLLGVATTFFVIEVVV